MTSDTTNSTRNTTNKIWAIPLAAPAIPPKPNTAAIIAIIRKAIAHDSITLSPLFPSLHRPVKTSVRNPARGVPLTGSYSSIACFRPGERSRRWCARHSSPYLLYMSANREISSGHSVKLTSIDTFYAADVLCDRYCQFLAGFTTHPPSQRDFALAGLY